MAFVPRAFEVVVEGLAELADFGGSVLGGGDFPDGAFALLGIVLALGADGLELAVELLDGVLQFLDVALLGGWLVACSSKHGD